MPVSVQQNVVQALSGMLTAALLAAQKEGQTDD